MARSLAGGYTKQSHRKLSIDLQKHVRCNVLRIFILLASEHESVKQKLTSVHPRHFPTTKTSLPRDGVGTNSLFLFFGTVLDQSGEFEVVEVAGFVEILFVEHLIDFFFGESFSHGHEETFKFFAGDDLQTVRVEAFEGVLDDIFGIGTMEFLTEERKEGGEVDIAGRFLDHVLEVGLWWIFTHRGEHTSQIFFGDEAVTILVDHVEGFLELLDLRLREQREHVGGGLLGLLFSGSLLLAHGDS